MKIPDSMNFALSLGNDFKSKFEKLKITGKQLQNMASQVSERNKELETKKKKSSNKKNGSIVVNGSTSKEQIRKYMLALRKKISEIAMDKDMEKTVKMSSIRLLEQKVSDLEVLIKSIDKAKKESMITKKQKKAKGKVVLHDDDLRLKETDGGSSNSSGGGSVSTAMSFDAVSPAADIATSTGGSDSSNIDVEV